MACATFYNAIFEEVRSLGGLVDEGEGFEGFELRVGGWWLLSCAANCGGFLGDSIFMAAYDRRKGKITAER